MTDRIIKDKHMKLVKTGKKSKKFFILHSHLCIFISFFFCHNPFYFSRGSLEGQDLQFVKGCLKNPLFKKRWWQFYTNLKSLLKLLH